MAASPKRISWDACTWIALIQKEKIRDLTGAVIEDRYGLARSVIDLATMGKIEIAVSGLCLGEVVKNPPGETSGDDKVGPFFEHDYILIVAVDKQVGTIARQLVRGHTALKPPDAVHLATAMVANVDEMHTFDRRLLDLDGQLVKNDGTALKICKPTHGGPELPLMEAAKQAAEPVELPAPEATEPQKTAASEQHEASADSQAANSNGAALAESPEPAKINGEAPIPSLTEVKPAPEVLEVTPAPPPVQPEGPNA